MSAAGAGCPLGVRCESCGRERTDLAVVELATAAGVLCATLCPGCAAGVTSAGLPVTVETAGRLVAQHRDHLAVAAGTAVTCPRCRRTSHHPRDVHEGYCGACHDWTGVPRLVAP